MLVKAVKELPAGTRERYEKIADYVQNHARTPYRRDAKVSLFTCSGAVLSCRSLLCRRSALLFVFMFKDCIARLKNMQTPSETLKQKVNEDAFENYATVRQLPFRCLFVLRSLTLPVSPPHQGKVKDKTDPTESVPTQRDDGTTCSLLLSCIPRMKPDSILNSLDRVSFVRGVRQQGLVC